MTHKVPERFKGKTTQTITRGKLVELGACESAMRLWDSPVLNIGDTVTLEFNDGVPNQDTVILLNIFRDYLSWAIENGLLTLRWADLKGADLTGADLRGADLRWADLTGADLRWADLRWADLRGADLRWADLRWADLRWATFESPSGDIQILGD